MNWFVSLKLMDIFKEALGCVTDANIGKFIIVILLYELCNKSES